MKKIYPIHPIDLKRKTKRHEATLRVEIDDELVERLMNQILKVPTDKAYIKRIYLVMEEE